ncbi:MAG: hypothetical protein IKW51_08655 [Bacteroidales bacterium]|nr:hypothetical protein [Bacteroidales bacterium]
MFYFIVVIGLIFSVKEIIAEKLEKTLVNTHFNWNEYWKDIRYGMTTEQQLKKRQSGGYTTTSLCSSNHKNIFDHERYNYDKKLYGETIAEIWKKNGSYDFIKSSK